LDHIELTRREELEASLAACLRERRMPDHFLYLDTAGTDSWLELDGAADFPVASDLTCLLETSLPRLIPHLPHHFNLVSIGVGSGEKERLITEAARTAGHQPRYLAVDISREMVSAALATVADIEIEKVGVVAFLEDLPRLRHLWEGPVLLCLLGNNFCNYEPDALLALIAGELEPGDRLLFDCQILPDGTDLTESLARIERAYRCPANARFNANPLVRRGLAPHGYAFHLELVPIMTTMGITYRTRKWLEITRDSAVDCDGQRIEFQSGEVIHLGFTYKYTAGQVSGYLGSHGFREVESFASGDGGNLLVLAEATTEGKGGPR